LRFAKLRSLIHRPFVPFTVIVTRAGVLCHGAILLCLAHAVNVLDMLSVARLLQLIGLTIPPLAVIAQLMGNIDLKQMLGFLVVSVAVFAIGYLMQRYSGNGPG
jgi:hypothetical protein